MLQETIKAKNNSKRERIKLEHDLETKKGWQQKTQTAKDVPYLASIQFTELGSRAVTVVAFKPLGNFFAARHFFIPGPNKVPGLREADRHVQGQACGSTPRQGEIGKERY